MRIAVTGGAGFVGSTLVHRAVAAGHDVLNYDLLTAAAHLSDIWTLEDAPNYTLVQGDICDADVLRDTFKQFAPDVVVHLAQQGPNAIAGDPQNAFLSTNVMGVEKVMQATVHAGTTRIVLPHHLSHNRQGRNELFCASKDASMVVANALQSQLGVQVIHTYAPSVFGVRQAPNHPISLTLNRLFTEQQVVIPNGPGVAMELIGVEDYANALLTLAVQDTQTDGPIRLLGPRKIRPVGVARHMCNALQHRYADSDKRFSDLLDVRKSDLVQTPEPILDGDRAVIRGRTPFHRSIWSTVKWYLAQPQATRTGKSKRTVTVEHAA